MFRSIEDVVVLWSPEQHLYVKGNIGVGVQQLADLQSWLSMHGSHWTIVLMDQASDQAYTANDGRDYVGMDAVEHALGYGLSNQTAFGKLEHPVTKETDGAIFVLFLKERKLSYFASDAQDRRGLGQANWIGELDQGAFRAMRGGGRIIDAVKDTVQLVNRRLDRAIEAEADAARRAEQELQRAMDALRTAISTTRESMAEVQRESEALRQQIPSASGPLAVPPVDQWGRKIDEIEAQLRPENVRTLEQRLAVVSDAIAQFLNAHAARKNIGAQTEALRQHALSLQVAPGGVAKQAAAEVLQLVEQARQSAHEGKLDLAELLARADEVNRKGDAAVEKERQRLEQARLRWRWIRGTGLVMLALLLASLAAIGWVLNRRRRPAMVRAKLQFAQREESVRKEIDDIDQLFKRNSDILGSKEKIVARGYEGKTREVSNRALDYVDDLFIMSKEVHRVLSEARELIFPTNPLGFLVNLFSSGRYERAINHVSGKPLKFSRSGGLPQVFDNLVDQKNAQNLGGSHPDVPDQISMTFEEVFHALKQRSDEAEHALDTFENSLANVHDALTNLQKEFEAANEHEKQLAAAAERDGYFALPQYFDALIPAIQSDLAEADRLATFDAVQAMQLSIPTAKRKLDQSRELANHCSQAREELFPILHAVADKLKALQYTSDWIDADLDQITATANASMKTAASQSIASEIASVSAALAALKDKAATSVETATRIDQQLIPELTGLESRIAETRQSLRASLQITTQEVLMELDRNPNDFLARGRKNLEAAKNMLLQGRTDAALSAIATANTETTRADVILKDSKAAVQSFEQRQQSAEAKLRALRSRIPELQSELSSASHSYAASALLVPVADSNAAAGTVRAADTARSAENARVGAADVPTSEGRHPAMPLEHLAASAESAMREALTLLGQTTREHQRGRVLQAAEMHVRADQFLASAQQALVLVTEHLAHLESQSRENVAAQEQYEAQSRNLAAAEKDALVTADTLADIAQLSLSVQQSRQSLSSARSATNPFQHAQTLSGIRQRIEELQSRIIADRLGHAEASRAVAGAQRQFDAARQLVQQSQSDGIADSRETTLANERIATLGRELVSVQREIRIAHGDWKDTDDRASRLQADLSSATKTLSSELQAAGQALQAFQQASQIVFQAEKWSGAWGARVLGSPGVRELERARAGLEAGNYSIVFEISRLAAAAAQAAIQQAEREIARRRMEEAHAAERARRARDAAMRPRLDGPLSGGFSGGIGSRGSSSSTPSSTSNTSGFSRSGW